MVGSTTVTADGSTMANLLHVTKLPALIAQDWLVAWLKVGSCPTNVQRSQTCEPRIRSLVYRDNSRFPFLPFEHRAVLDVSVIQRCVLGFQGFWHLLWI